MIDNYYLKEARKLSININVFLGENFQERQSKSRAIENFYDFLGFQPQTEGSPTLKLAMVKTLEVKKINWKIKICQQIRQQICQKKIIKKFVKKFVKKNSSKKFVK